MNEHKIVWLTGAKVLAFFSDFA